MKKLINALLCFINPVIAIGFAPTELLISKAVREKIIRENPLLIEYAIMS